MSTVTPPSPAALNQTAEQVPAVVPAITPTEVSATTPPAVTETTTQGQPPTEDPIYGDYPENASLFVVPDGLNHPDQLIQYFDSQAEVDQYLMDQATKAGKAFERVVVFEAEAAATPAPTPAASQQQDVTAAAPAPTPAVPAATPAPTPALVAQPPQDVLESQTAAMLLEKQYNENAESLKAVNAQREQIEKSYGDGDISDDEYQKKIAGLDSQSAAAVEKAKQIEQMHAQHKLKVDTFQQVQQMQIEQAFSADLTAFMSRPENQLFETSSIHANAFKETFAQLDALPENSSLTNQQLLQKTRDELAKLFVLPAGQAPAPTPAPAVPAATQKPAQTPAAKPAVDIPITLDQLPTAASNGTGTTDPFAHIRELTGQAYQDAYNKLSESQREELLLSFGS